MADATSETGQHRGSILEGVDGFGTHPQPVYAGMRAGGPARRAHATAVIVSTRSAIDDVLRHPEDFSSVMPLGRLGNVRPLIPIEVDPPDQKKFRKLLDPLFAPQKMALLEEPVRVLVNRLIDDFGDASEIDFARQFSVPLPSQVFLTLLGLPLEDLPKFLAMKDGIIRPFHVLGVSHGDPACIEYQQQTGQSIYDYFDAILDEREREPRDDLLSHFLSVEVDGDRLSRTDILDICFLFLIAGLDTVTSSLECFFAFLAEHPEHRAQLVADPAITPKAVEELLRWETPVMLVSRRATRDTEIQGCPVHAGDEVYTFLGSANTDDAEFPDADVVRFDRYENRHITFGGGVHRCLGSHLARLELRVALTEWHRRIPDYRIAPGADLDFTVGVRSLDAFPMILGESI